MPAQAVMPVVFVPGPISLGAVQTVTAAERAKASATRQYV